MRVGLVAIAIWELGILSTTLAGAYSGAISPLVAYD